jgi:hypothetical protein
MPLAGLVLNRTHPTLCSLPIERAIDGSETLESETESEAASLAAAVLTIHADRAQTAKREIRLLSRFTGANPHVPVIGVPSLPFDVSDLEALRAIAHRPTPIRHETTKAIGHLRCNRNVIMKTVIFRTVRTLSPGVVGRVPIHAGQPTLRPRRFSK